ncbi:MAG TPA: hypothetical protein VFA33_16450 [Bryobacteraceae bacterium]|nr:hypothetical protein [Bryobacteraceae bacterium]
MKAQGTSGRRALQKAASPAVPVAKRPFVKHVLLVAALAGFTFCAYSNSLHAPFLMDSEGIILKDARVHSLSAVQFHRIWIRQYWETIPNGLFRPLTTMSYLFNYAILGNGTAPEGYHWFNLLLHAINVGLVYTLGLAIFEQIPAALLLGALWGVHPVLTESVTYLVGRADLLAAFGVLAALLCHRRGLQTSGGRRAAWLAAVACAVAIGMFSKENAIVALAVLPLYDVTFAPAAPWRSRLASYLAATAPCLAFLYQRGQVLAGTPFSPTPFCENPLLWADFWTARLTAVKVIGRYSGLLLWPARLSCDYSYNEIPLFGWSLGNPEDWKAILALAACAALAALGILSWRRHKPLFFFIAFFFITLAPTSNVFLQIGTIMGERFLYLPSVGFLGAAAYGLSVLWRHIPANRYAYRFAGGAAVGVILIAGALRTYARNEDWLDHHRLWVSAAVAAPGSSTAHLNAATTTYILTRADWDGAVREIERGLAILDALPDSRNAPNAYLDASIFYSYLGDRLASKNAPGNVRGGPYAEYWYRRSLDAILRAEQIQVAWAEYSRLENQRRGKPGREFLPARLYLEMGRAYMRLSDVPHALAAFERGRTLESDPDLLEDAAAAYRAAGEPRKAAQALVEALAVDSSRVQLTPLVVELYGQIDPQGCAILRQGGAPSLNPDCPLVHGDICGAYRNIAGTYVRRGQQYEAGAVRRVAIQELGCAPGLVN